MRARRVAIPAITHPPHTFKDVAVRRCIGETMGTTWSVAFAAPTALTVDDVQTTVQQCLDRIVAQMSPWEPASDIVRYNQAPRGRWVDLPQEFITVLNAGCAICFETGGAYDPACGALVDLWGFGPTPSRTTPPLQKKIDAVRPGAREQLRIDAEGQRVLQPGGVALDFSSIAKGFGVDQAGRALDALGAVSWLVDIGGELKGRGVKPNGEPWWATLDATGAGVRSGNHDFVVALHNLAIATSGNRVKYFDHGGERYSHILDPRTGYPAAGGLSAVTVLHESAMMADAYATAIFVLGPMDGFAFAEKNGLAARLVGWREADGDERITAALKTMLD